MGNKNYSYLPDCGTAEVAKNKAAKSILKWAGLHLPEHQADEDEPVDQVESVGFSAIRDSTADEPTMCLGFACNMPVHICDVCKLLKIDEISEAFTEINRILSTGPVEMESPAKPVFQSWHDARYDLYSSASTSRGARVSIELRLAARMNIF